MKHSAKGILILSLFFFGLLSVRNDVYSKTDVTGIPLDANPRAIAINPATDIVVITNNKADSVSIVDLNTQTVLSIISAGRSPRGVAIDGASNIALVSNNQDDSVSVIDLYARHVIATIPSGKSPEGVAVNSSTRKAIVANNADDTVSVIDLTTLKNIGTMPVGRKPMDLAIDPELNRLLVVNEKDNNVSIIDLNTYESIGRVAVGKKPRSIAINSETHLAVVANEKDDSISVVNLETWQTTSIPTEKHPIAVAINQLDNTALVVCDEDRSLPLIDLDTKTTIKTYPLNTLPKGVAVNNFTNVAAVTDDKTDSLTLIHLPNPLPEITFITPDNAERGGNEVTAIIEGNKFIKTSAVSINQSAGYEISSVFMDNHHIRGTFPKAAFSKAGVFPFTVINPLPAGGVSNSLTFTINNPVPSISALAPAEVFAGSQGLTLSVYGTGYFDDTEFYFGGEKKSVLYVSKSNLEADLTADDLKIPGMYELAAYNASPGGGDSNKMVFSVKSPLDIKITLPLHNVTVNKAKLIVRGTFKAVSQDVGIKVNGKIAEISGNEWVVDGVPLLVGTNTITATISDSSGSSVNSAISINVANIFQPVRLSANITSGIPPLATYFSVLTEISNPIAGYQVDFEGDGVVDYAGSTFEGTGHSFAAEGIYYPTITVTDSQGNSFSDTIAITVMSKTEIDTLLKSKWEGMKGALAIGDTEGALSYFIGRSQEKYRKVFSALKEQLPDILGTFIEFNIKDLYENIAEYEVVANEGGVLYSYPGIFIRGGDGLWKFRDF